jgi:hypothetical protein
VIGVHRRLIQQDDGGEMRLQGRQSERCGACVARNDSHWWACRGDRSLREAGGGPGLWSEGPRLLHQRTGILSVMVATSQCEC